MRDGGRITATIEILEDFAQRRVPLKICLSDWARGARFAGSKDRAFIGGLALDILRSRQTFYHAGGAWRSAVALALLRKWSWPLSRVEEAYAEEPHGPGPLSEAEKERLKAPMDGEESQEPNALNANMPDFIFPLFTKMTDHPLEEARAFEQRASVDIRVNTLKCDPERALKALSSMGAVPTPFAKNGLRLPAGPPEKKSPQLSITPAFQKGWIEIQDEASQLATLAVGALKGGQVLDYCAGGGGKTLALAAHMANQGQIYAYDKDAKRLAPIFERLKRAGVRNVQVISPAEGTGKLDDLKDRMDVVFIDAPCSGVGTWRRHPDAKWRLTVEQLEKRISEQKQVLEEAFSYVAPGGSLIYATCSLLIEENEDILSSFLADHKEFQVDNALDAILNSGGISPDASFDEGVSIPENSLKTIRFSPYRTQTDGFTITRLKRENAKI
ncbi:MAG: RsmB/NOP family class I SAM-dependent RNA methyltransferase [Pseudomonadota bacterium]